MIKALIGNGGFAKEIIVHIGDPTIKRFIDDHYWEEGNEYIRPLSEFDPSKYEVLIAIGDPKMRYDMSQRLPSNTKYFSFIHPSAQVLDKDLEIGEGSIVCAGCILTTNIKIGKHAHLNLHTTIGHDCRIGDYFTTAPGVKVSGNCNLGDCVYLGTNSSIREKINICNNVTIGLGSGIVKHILEPGTYVGLPTKKIK
jgi:sugar O-acyltransferase (sialic acid O-acetyltransferase NeuD family)